MIMTMMVMMIVILPSSSVVTSFHLKAHPESGTFSVYACSLSFDNYPNVVCSMYYSEDVFRSRCQAWPGQICPLHK